MYRVLIGFRRVSILLKNPTEAPSQNPFALLRIYPMKLVKKLYSSFVERRAADSTRLCLRAKNSINPVLTDRELFQSMPLGDAWEDAFGGFGIFLSPEGAVSGDS